MARQQAAFLAGRMHAERRASIAFAAEAALLAASAAIAAGSGSDLTGRGPVLYAIIILTGLAMGIRNATVRKLGVADLTTTARPRGAGAAA